MRTHHNFKSSVAGVCSAADMLELVGEALYHQDKFERKTTPWEMSSWDQQELHDFHIDLEMIDRLYYINHTNDGVSGSTFHMLARMEYRDAPVFVELSAGCDYTGFDCQGGGDIFVTRHADLFCKVVTRPDTGDGLQPLYLSLVEDGYEVEEQTEHDRLPVTCWHNPPALRFLCHLAVYHNLHRLHFYPRVLPKPLIDSVQEFVKVREAITAYDDSE